MSHLIIAPVLLPLLTGLLLLLLSGRDLRLLRTLSLLSAGALLVVSALLMNEASRGSIGIYALGNWAPPFGIVLVLDRLSALMLTVTSVLALFSLWYAACNKDQPGDNLHALVHFLLLGVNGAFLTGDLFNLFVFFEVLLLASYALLLHGGGARRTKAGLHYVVLNLAGSSLFLIALALLYGLTGTLNMADMALQIPRTNPEDLPLIHTGALLLLLVFGLKAALVPLYFWLPRAYASASAPVAALFAIMTKVGVYAIVRVYSLSFGELEGGLAGFVTAWLWPVALLTLALGVVGTLAARELRLQIAYLVVVSVGTLLAGVALNSSAALSASFYYLVHSTWICGALFLLADLIRHQRGSHSDLIIGGPALRQPVLLGALFFTAAVSVVGMPPLSGFIGKLLLLQAAGASELSSLWFWIILLLGGLATLAALSRSGSTLFWRTEAALQVSAEPAPRMALGAVIGLLSLSLVLSLAGDSLQQYTQALAEQILRPGDYVHAILNHQPLQEAGR